MSTAPHEICRRLGEARFKDMFLSLSAAAMKQSLSEAGLQATRGVQASTRKRNEDWARRLWQSVQSPAKPAPVRLFLFEWLRQTHGKMLALFLDTLEVPHQGGLTDADFMKDLPDEKLLGAAKLLLAHPDFDQRDVAAYLLFLDHSNETERFAALNLEQTLKP